MRFNAPAGQVNQQRGGQHLSHGDNVAGQHFPGLGEREEDGEARNGAAQQEGRPDVQMDVADLSNPRLRGNPQGGNDACEPLQSHQRGKHTVGAFVELILALLKEFVNAPLGRFATFWRWCC